MNIVLSYDVEHLLLMAYLKTHKLDTSLKYSNVNINEKVESQNSNKILSNRFVSYRLPGLLFYLCYYKALRGVYYYPIFNDLWDKITMVSLAAIYHCTSPISR